MVTEQPEIIATKRVNDATEAGHTILMVHPRFLMLETVVFTLSNVLPTIKMRPMWQGLHMPLVRPFTKLTVRLQGLVITFIIALSIYQ